MSAMPARAIVHLLAHDALVQLYVALVAVEAVIYTVPLMDPGTLAVFGASPFQIPFLATVVAAAFLNPPLAPAAEERKFWAQMGWAVVAWLATLVWIALVPVGVWTDRYDVLVGASYLVFYVPILLAGERKPHLQQAGESRETERQLRWAGVALVVVGFFAYFVAAPVALEPHVLRSDVSSSLLFLTIDAGIVIRFTWRAWSCGSVRWRVLYGTLAAAGVSLAAVDALDLLAAIEVSVLQDGALTDLIWAIPPFFFLAAFRLRGADLPRTVDTDRARRAVDRSLDPMRVGALLVGGALCFPAVHFILPVVFIFSEALVHAQRLIVFGEMVALGALATVAYHVLARERLASERAREAFEERLRQAHKLEAVARLAGVVSRELTPPLEALRNLVDRTLDDVPIGDPEREKAQRAAEQLRRLTELSRHLSAVSRQRRGQTARVDLAEAIASARPALESALGPSVRIETAPAKGCVTLIDPNDVQTMLLDLAANAREAMPHGGRFGIEVGRVNLDAASAVPLAVRPGVYVRLLVRDTGRGIPGDVRSHLFEPFYSTKSREAGVTAAGIGLASLYAIVTQLGGCVTVTSEMGEGSAFEILLPAA